MTRRLIPALGFATAIATLAIATPALAAEEDTQFWGFFEVEAPLGPNARAGLELSPRFSDGPDSMETRLLVEFDVAEGVELGGGLVHGAFPGANELRPFQQAELKAGPFQSRTRLEQRFFDGADRTEWRVRQRLLVSHPIAPDWDISGDVELFYVLRDRDPSREAAVDNWRFTLAASHAVNDKLNVGLGYMLMLSPNGSAESEISHVPQVSVKYSL